MVESHTIKPKIIKPAMETTKATINWPGPSMSPCAAASIMNTLIYEHHMSINIDNEHPDICTAVPACVGNAVATCAE